MRNSSEFQKRCLLTHWGRVTHICVNKLTIIGSDNGLSPDRRQAIIWTNAGILLIGALGTNFSEILIEILTFSFKKMRLKVSSVKRRPFCLGLNVLMFMDTALCYHKTQHIAYYGSKFVRWSKILLKMVYNILHNQLPYLRLGTCFIPNLLHINEPGHKKTYFKNAIFTLNSKSPSTSKKILTHLLAKH